MWYKEVVLQKRKGCLRSLGTGDVRVRVTGGVGDLEESLPRNLEHICQSKHERSMTGILTAQAPATVATIPPEIIIGRIPLVLLKIIPLSAPATILFAESCFPREYPIKELNPL